LAGMGLVTLDDDIYGRRYLYCEGAPDLLFTDNDTNASRLFGGANASAFVEDGINDLLVAGKAGAVTPDASGTKCAARYRATVPAGGSAELHMRFSDTALAARF